MSLHTSIRCNFCGNFSPTCKTVVAQQKQGLFLSACGELPPPKRAPKWPRIRKFQWHIGPRSIYCPLATPRRASQSETMHSCTFRLCYLQRFAPKLKNEKQHWSSYQDTANLVCFLELLTTNQALIPCEDNGREGRSLTCSFLTHTMGEYTQRWRLKTVFLFLVV